MAPFIPPSRGFIANLHSPTSVLARGHGYRTIVLASVMILVIVAVSLLPAVPFKMNETGNESIPSTPVNNSYAFKVYTLNHTSLNHVVKGTVFLFNTTLLPVKFDIIQFGDFRTDTQFRSTYYAGSGIILNVTGSNSSITLREYNGKLAGSVFYHGQSLVVFNGQTMTYLNSSKFTICNGTDEMVQDWRTGNWTPNNGIIIEHPSNVTVASARFYLAVYQPGVDASLPEFELLPVFAMTFAIVTTTIWRRRRVSPLHAEKLDIASQPTENEITGEPIPKLEDEH